MLESMRILVVEDDKKIASFVVNGLKQSGYAVDHSPDGENGLIMTQTISYDAAVVDVMLPKLDGLSVIQQLRAKGTHMPVLILSAKASVDDRVRGLQAGGALPVDAQDPAHRPHDPASAAAPETPEDAASVRAVRLLRAAGTHPGAHTPLHAYAGADTPLGRRPDHGPAHARSAARRRED